LAGGNMGNSKSEALNPKQIQSLNVQNSKSLGNLNLDIRYCLEFRILKLGFKDTKNAS
jgi:hypothetical protein